MKLRCAAVLLTALGLVWPCLPAGAIQPDIVPAGDGPVWDGRQFVAADRAGNVFFLRAETFEVYPVTKAGELGKPLRLETASTGGGELYDAALSPAGDTWLLRTSRGVRLFSRGKEKILPPLAWLPFSAGFLRDSPVVGVAPIPTAPKQSKNVQTLPWLMRLDEDRWTTLLDREGPTFSELVKRENWFGEVLESEPASLATDRQGRLWVARRYAYHVRRLSPGGRTLLEITIEGGKIRRKKESKAVEIERPRPSRDAVEKSPVGGDKASFYPFTAQEVIQDVVEGRDGRMYFLVVLEGGRAALDRYDPVQVAVERTPLQGVRGNGWLTLAAGRSGLYLAAWEGTANRWHLSWDALEQASWKVVEGAAIDGVSKDERTSASR